MRLNKFLILFACISLWLACCTKARRIGRREFSKKRSKQAQENVNAIPIFRSLDAFAQAHVNGQSYKRQSMLLKKPLEELRTLEQMPVSNQAELTKLVLLKPEEQASDIITTNSDYDNKMDDEDVKASEFDEQDTRRAAKVPKLVLIKQHAMPAKESTSTSRTFKHLLMYKALLGDNSGYGSGGGGDGGGYSIPNIYIINPTNVTNVNNNTAVNNDITTPTTTTAGGRRVDSLSQNPITIPVPIRMPTEVYQQRQSADSNGPLMPVPAIVMAMDWNGGRLIPLDIPSNYQIAQQQQQKRPSGNIKRRRRVNVAPNNMNTDNNNNKINPFIAFANNLRRMQFL